MNNIDLTSTNQKIFAGVLVVAVLLLLNFLLPPLVVLFANLWMLAIMALPVAYIIMNPMVVWNIFKQLSWNLTKKLISGDKLGYAYRYHEYLLGKIDNLDKSIESVSSMKIKVQRKVVELNTSIKENSKLATVHQEKNSPQTVIRTIANKISIDNKQLESLLPRVVNIETQESSLKDLYNNWIADAEDLKYSLDAKAEEYNLLKELSAVAGNANEFLRGNSEEYKLYQESLVQIEESVTKYAANVENFERKVKPMLENISMNRTVAEDEGLLLIEEFKKNSISLKLN